MADQERFGRWAVIGRGHDYRHVLCKCVCGNIREVRTDHLKDGSSRSCGCIKKEQHPWIYKGKPGRKRLNGIYGSMLWRCNNSNSDHYKNYGGRGISVCKEWEDSFDDFANWAYNNGYEPGLTLDRIDNDKGYSKDNCRWVTMKEQQANKRTNIVFEINGERKIAKDVAEMFGVKPNRIYAWLKKGLSKDEVLRMLLNTKAGEAV